MSSLDIASFSDLHDFEAARALTASLYAQPLMPSRRLVEIGLKAKIAATAT
jgi:hypothetical protein